MGRKRIVRHEMLARRKSGTAVIFWTISMALVMGVGCDSGKAETQQALKNLAEGQKQIMERIAKIEKKVGRPAGRGRPQIDYNKVHDINVGKSPYRGSEEATVTLIEFSDFQCPYSKRVQPLINSLLKAYPNDLKHVYKNFPLRFHKRAEPAARACLAAGLQGKFWEMEELLYNNPKKLEDSDLKVYAQQIGLNVEQFEKDYKSEAVKKLVQDDMTQARKAQVSGTPSLFLNGKRVKDRSPESMKKQIEALRSQKKKG